MTDKKKPGTNSKTCTRIFSRDTPIKIRCLNSRMCMCLCVYYIDARRVVPVRSRNRLKFAGFSYNARILCVFFVVAFVSSRTINNGISWWYILWYVYPHMLACAFAFRASVCVFYSNDWTHAKRQHTPASWTARHFAQISFHTHTRVQTPPASSRQRQRQRHHHLQPRSILAFIQHVPPVCECVSAFAIGGWGRRVHGHLRMSGWSCCAHVGSDADVMMTVHSVMCMHHTTCITYVPDVYACKTEPVHAKIAPAAGERTTTIP